jgi:outer membrane protein
MNVEYSKKYRLKPNLNYLILMGLSFAQCLVFASDVPDGSFPDILKDPMGIQPPLLDSGSTLPGDKTPISCPPSLDLGQPLNLDNAADLSLCNNPQIKTAWAAIKIQAAALGESYAAYLPTFNGSVSRLNTKYSDLAAIDTANWGRTVYASLNWRIFDFGGRAANRNAAQATLAAALSQHNAILQKALSATISAYFDALTSQATLQARTLEAELAQQTLDVSQRKEHHGASGRNDTLQAATALARAQLSKQRANGEYAKALSVLNYTLGISPYVSLKLPTQSIPPVIESTQELSQWLELAQTQHPAIASVRSQLLAAQEKVYATRSEGLPTLDFTSNFYQNGYPNQGLQSTRSNTSTLGVTLTIPIFEGFARTYKIRSAQAQAEQSQAQLEDIEHQILSEVVKAHADAQSSLTNLMFSENLLNSAKDAYESSKNRYERGAADILEILSVQNSLGYAEQERIRCLSEWQSARLRLFAAGGILGIHKIRN